ncbi:NitT/TauT family transport system permease protein [Anaerocolumna xylanovorans DSM 12503]|uniref:NitT/TauT family transport system permease protein n=2 Tax=Anaerocolumna TaxID=1843210 RepID=A0A1M7YJU7_9FIRM|nr:NitT/TauT family transport system permease protein [Anaerocolumna xylanovorans DSM 12503]
MIFVQGFLSINLIWLIAFLLTDTPVIPNPLRVYQSFAIVLKDHMLIHILYSLRRIGAGLAISLIIGVPAGILLAYSRRANRILYPLIYFSYPIPKTALLPIAMLLLGMRDGSKVVIMVLVIVFQVIVSVRDSIQAIDKTMYQFIKSTGAGNLAIIRHVTLPAILPQLLTSLRVSLGAAVSILFFVEGYGTTYGMGYYILDAWSRINYIEMYIGIITIAVIGFLLFVSIDYLAYRICKWSYTGSSL